MKRLNQIFILALVIVFSCNKKSENDPETTIREYINYRFEPNQTKEGLVRFLDDEMKENIQELSEKDFEDFVNIDGLRKKKLSFIISKCEKQSCYITYTLSYEKYDNEIKMFEVEVRKIAEVKKSENESWKISSISNVKSFIDIKTDISP